MNKSKQDEYNKQFEDFVRKSVLVILNSRIENDESSFFSNAKTNTQVKISL